jgi:hypothetical protein
MCSAWCAARTRENQSEKQTQEEEMTTAINMYAMTWNAALATQGGLQTALQAFNAKVNKGGPPMRAEMIDGFQMAHAGQLAQLSTELALNAIPEGTVDRKTLNALAEGGLRLGAADLASSYSFTRDITPNLAKIHEARMAVSSGWFKAYAGKSPSEFPMPSSSLESSMLFWSVLLEDPDALERVVSQTGEPFLLAGMRGEGKPGFQMALASLLILLPYYGAAPSAAKLASENLRLCDWSAGTEEITSSIGRIAKELKDIPAETLTTAFVDLRTPGGSWSLWNPGPGVQARTHFRILSPFDHTGDLRNVIDSDTHAVVSAVRRYGKTMIED